jgi:hypothetical protein
MKKSDNSQIVKAIIDDIDGWVIPIIISNEEVATLLSAYNPADNYSPDAASSRELARLVLDALKTATGQ